MNIAKKLVDALKSKKQPSAYDTPAVVNRIEGQTAWVRIAGGIDETPVQKTIDAKAGDAVNVRISGGKAWITGNGTAPPTDDQVAIGVSHNLTMVTKTLTTRISSGEKEIKETKKIAEDAQTSADGKNTIFYSQTQPASGMKANDTWFNPNEGNAIYRYNGTAWVKEELGDDAIESVSADKITAGTIDASQITVSNLDAGNITSGKLSTDHIAAGSFTITGGTVNIETDSDDDSIIALNFDYSDGDIVSNMMQPGGDYLFYHDKDRREDTHFRTGRNISLTVKDDSYVTYPTKRSIEASVTQYGASEQKAQIRVNKHNTSGIVTAATVIEPEKITVAGKELPKELWTYLGKASNTGTNTDFVLPSSGAWLIMTINPNTEAFNSIWIVHNTSNLAFRISGPTPSTLVQCSGTTVGVRPTVAGTLRVYAQKIGEFSTF